MASHPSNGDNQDNGIPTVTGANGSSFGGWDTIKLVLTPIASLRLTVLLFVLSIILVFCGTLAQVEEGIWTVVGKYFRTFSYVQIPFRIFYYIPGFKSFMPQPSEIQGSFPFPGGYLIGAVMLINLLAAHAVRFKLSWKRSGILILHAGIVVLLLGELVAGLCQVEGRMSIDEGGSADYVYHTETPELAIIKTSDPSHDEVVAIPKGLLKQGARISYEQLPFDVEIVRYMPNSVLRRPGPDVHNPASAGAGLEWVAVEKREGTGVDSEQRIDIASAYVNFLRKDNGQSLGTYLLSVWVSEEAQFDSQAQAVEVATGPSGWFHTTYEVALRFKRTYKPYTIHLIDFTHDRYPGTDRPKNFQSRVRLVDPSRNEDRLVPISMNSPLRYRGEAFCQRGFKPGDNGTILQIVDNPGWLMPYVACTMVTLGLLIHFLINLVGFLNKLVQSPSPAARVTQAPVKRKKSVPIPEPVTPTTTDTDWVKILVPAGVVLLAVGYLLSHVRPPMSPEGLDLHEFGKLPVQHDGRYKPLDTLARNSLMIISKRQTFEDGKEENQSAIRWLLDVFTRKGREHQVFRIENEEVLGLLDLEPRKGFRYSYNEFRAKIRKIDEQAGRAKSLEQSHRGAFHIKVMELDSQVDLYEQLEEMRIGMIPHERFPNQWVPYGIVAGHAEERVLERFQALFPNLDPSKLDRDQEEKLRARLLEELRSARGEISPIAVAIGDVLDAYKVNNAERFNDAVEDYRVSMQEAGVGLGRSDFEAVFNRLSLFYYCAALCVIAVALNCIGWFEWASVLRSAAFWLLAVTAVAFFFGLVSRMYLMERPFVFITNLYGTAVFIGFTCVLLGLILELIYPLGIGNLVGGVIGFVALIIAHHLSTDGDTLAQLQAVLDTNLWLATHVTTINFGYAATFVAGLLGIIYLVITAATRSDDNPVGVIVARVLYGVVCFATLLSFTGTVLGGIWADQSWGRFWGWDPKENGALLIVLWNALILHARWGGMIKRRGMAVLAAAGTMITAWSWFGTNLLGVGLHAYGFMSGTAVWLGRFWVTMLVFTAFGMIPTSVWRNWFPVATARR